jgi:uncharacterized protein YndB with AHSA1/START domain
MMSIAQTEKRTAMAEHTSADSSAGTAGAILSSFVLFDREIVITRTFDAPRALLFKVWTDPKHIAQWWGPTGFTTPACEIDLRVGGAFVVNLLGPDGVAYPAKGVFREIIEPERIVFVGVSEDGPACGSGLPPRSTITVTFEEQDGKTLLTMTTVLESITDRDAAIASGFNTGWGISLERMAEYVTKGEAI